MEQFQVLCALTSSQASELPVVYNAALEKPPSKSSNYFIEIIKHFQCQSCFNVSLSTI